jgi:hypothetical protein
MCERKPGPRCSADTLKTLNLFRNKLMEFKAGLAGAPSSAASAEEYEGFLQEAVMFAWYNYDATPEGIESLKDDIDSSRKSGLKIPIDISQVDLPNAITMSNSVSAEIKLKHAEEHRDWQKATLKELESMKKGEAQGFIGLATDTLRGIVQYDNAVLEKYTHEKETWFMLDQSYLVEHTRRLNKLEYQIQNLRHKTAYNIIKINDLSKTTFGE